MSASPNYPPTLWKKFELLAEKLWVVSLDNHNNILEEIEEIAPEIQMMKKLAKCDPETTKIYLKFNQRIQNEIQSEIEDALENKTINPYRTPSLGDLSVDNICYDFFGITFEAQLMIWEDLNGKGIIRVWDTTPTMVNDRVITFRACIEPSPSTDIKIIEDTQIFLKEICIPNGVALGHGYCRNVMKEKKINIPYALIKMIIKYFNIDLKTINKYWINNK